MSNLFVQKTSNFFKGLLIFLVIILLCALASLIIAFPLWKFASVAPKIYTITVLVLLFGLIIYSIIRRIFRNHKKNEKRNKD